jgi:uncharacterized membrane protein YjjP (DUF1212 family)
VFAKPALTPVCFGLILPRRKYGKTKWPFCPSKSIVGSVAFVLGGFAVTAALLWLLSATGE